jgi:hypothetical protein
VIEVVTRNERRLRGGRDSKSWRLFGAVLGVHAVIALAVGEIAWDDGYITLAFARTFAETGHIGLTPFSETVEGATSPLWFVLMAGVYKLGCTSFYGFHLASQLIAALCAAGTAVLLYRLIRPHAPAAAWWIAFFAMMLGPFRTETANGMEMTLLCVVVLAAMSLIRDDERQPLLGLTVLTAVVPVIRLEAAGYMIAGALAIVVFSRQIRVGVAIIAGSLLAIALISVVRFQVFSTVVLTNTMIAKQLSPYSPPLGTPAWNLQLLVSIVIEPVVTVLPALIVAFLLSRMSGVTVAEGFRRIVAPARARTMPARMSFGIAYSLGFFGFTLVVGSNYFAPPGRMGASAMLALIVVAAMAIPVPDNPPAHPLTRRRYAALAAVALIPFLGVFTQDAAWIYLARLNTDPKLAFNTTTAYRRNGEAFDHVRTLLAQPTLSVLLADVGAPGLCCERLNIQDLGLLANTNLSASGWAGFGDYLRAKRPDVIQTHGVWSQESGIYQNPDFTGDYTPVVVYDSLFYLRNDHFQSLTDRCIGASTSAPYFYAGLEPAAAKKGTGDVNTIDAKYRASLSLSHFCRLP